MPQATSDCRVRVLWPSGATESVERTAKEDLGPCRIQLDPRDPARLLQYVLFRQLRPGDNLPREVEVSTEQVMIRLPVE